MLNSSGGFSTPTAPLSSSSSDRTASYSPSPVITPSQRPSNNSVFLIDDELFSLSSRSEHHPNSFSEEPFSPSDGHSSTPPTSKRLMSNSTSPSLPLQQHSPTARHSAPLYISVHTSTPSIPLAKSFVSVFISHSKSNGWSRFLVQRSFVLFRREETRSVDGHDQTSDHLVDASSTIDRFRSRGRIRFDLLYLLNRRIRLRTRENDETFLWIVFLPCDCSLFLFFCNNLF